MVAARRGPGEATVAMIQAQGVKRGVSRHRSMYRCLSKIKDTTRDQLSRFGLACESWSACGVPVGVPGARTAYRAQGKTIRYQSATTSVLCHKRRCWMKPIGVLSVLCLCCLQLIGPLEGAAQVHLGVTSGE